MKARKFATCFTLLATFSLLTLVKALDPIATLSPSDVPAGWGNGFGFSVSISGDYIAVGAPYDPWYNGENTGAVYVFRRHGARWIEQVKLTVADGVWPDQLGYSVAIDGDVLVAGAPKYDWGSCAAAGEGTTAAYVFRRDHRGTPDDPADDIRAQEAKLTPPNPLARGRFGNTVGISGNVVVVGDECGDVAYVYHRKGTDWSYEATLTGSDMDGRTFFGVALGIDREHIVAGARPYQDRPGAAFVFVRDESGWREEAILTPSNPTGTGGFGWSVDIAGDSVVVGAPHSYASLPPIYTEPPWGGAYVFVRHSSSKWSEQPKLTGSTAVRNDELGYSVAIDDDLVVAGKWGDPWACLFQRVDDEWVQTDGLFGYEDGLGKSVDIAGNFAAVFNFIYAVRNRRNLRDHAAFQSCFTGSTTTELGPTCEAYDLTGDGRVDLADFEDFMGAFAGP